MSVCLMIAHVAALGFGIQLQPGRRSFTPPDEPAVVVDLRPRAEFRACHLEGSASVPSDELSALLYTLPPPAEWPVSLLGTREQLAEAQALLQPKGWSAKELLVERASELERLGPTSAGDDSAATGPPTWRPNSFLAAVLRSQQLAAPPAGLVVDVGCGSGRDAVYLRQQLQARRLLPTAAPPRHRGCSLSLSLSLSHSRSRSRSRSRSLTASILSPSLIHQAACPPSPTHCAMVGWPRSRASP